MRVLSTLPLSLLLFGTTHAGPLTPTAAAVINEMVSFGVVVGRSCQFVVIKAMLAAMLLDVLSPASPVVPIGA